MMRLIFLCLLLLMMAGCYTDQVRVDIGQSAQVIYNAACSLPTSPQVTAIQANAAAIGKAAGYPLTIPERGEP